MNDLLMCDVLFSYVEIIAQTIRFFMLTLYANACQALKKVKKQVGISPAFNF